MYFFHILLCSNQSDWLIVSRDQSRTHIDNWEIRLIVFKVSEHEYICIIVIAPLLFIDLRTSLQFGVYLLTGLKARLFFSTLDILNIVQKIHRILIYIIVSDSETTFLSATTSLYFLIYSAKRARSNNLTSLFASLFGKNIIKIKMSLSWFVQKAFWLVSLENFKEGKCFILPPFFVNCVAGQKLFRRL